MTKADIVEKVYEKIGLTKKECQELVDKVFEIMKEALEKGEKVKISSFGTFTVKQKKERKGRNPQTGETITLAPRKVLSFKPSKILRDEINKGK